MTACTTVVLVIPWHPQQ